MKKSLQAIYYLAYKPGVALQCGIFSVEPWDRHGRIRQKHGLNGGSGSQKPPALLLLRCP
jgi:hypothetical protein